MLAAEYMAAMAIAIIILFHDDGKSTYHQRMAKFFIQMTGITGLFFVLSLTATSERVSRYAIPFGLLVDVSMVIFAFKSGAGQVFGQALGVTPKETPEQIQHRLDVANPDAQPDLIAPGLIISPPTVPRSIPAFGTDLNPTPKIQNPLVPVPGGNTPSSPTIPNPLFPGPGGN
jgi:hypothetical protein